MKTSLLFDLTIDKTTNTIFVNRAFAADITSVWDAFTKPEILDEWWAPKPYTSKTKSIDFKVGGRRFYAMISPEGQEHWVVQKFTAINPTTNFNFLSSFTDKEENINTEWPSSQWELNFTNDGETTTIRIAIKHKSLADLDKTVQTGFKEGFTMTLNYLEKLLAGNNK